MTTWRKKHKFERRIGIKLDSFLRLNIIQAKLCLEAMRAFNNKLLVLLSLLCHISNTKAAYIVATTAWNKHMVEISKANRTAVFKSKLQLLNFREINHELNIFLLNCSLNSYFIPLSDFFCVTAMISLWILWLTRIPKLLIKVLNHRGLKRRILLLKF